MHITGKMITQARVCTTQPSEDVSLSFDMIGNLSHVLFIVTKIMSRLY